MSGGRYFMNAPAGGGGGGLAISGTSGTLSDGSAVTISGSSFGTKSAAAPKVWEDFAGSLNANLDEHGGAFNIANTTNLRHTHAAHNARADFHTVGSFFDGHYFEYSGSDAPKWFTQYWVKLATNWSWGTTVEGGGNSSVANVKFVRYFPGGRTYTNVGYSMQNFVGGDIIRFIEHGSAGQGNAYLGVDGKDWFTLDTWHCVQVEMKENTGVDAANGHIRLWFDGALMDERTNFVTNTSDDAGDTTDKRPYILGFYDSWPQSGSTMYAYFCDLYVDDTWARVELGNNSVYDNCTHREMQIPTSWSSTAIGVTFKPGSFSGGASAWLFVIDSNGNKTAGFPVTLA